jgi:hypothetical protein
VGTTQHIAKVRKNYKVSTRPPATLPLSSRVLNCPFSLPALNAQLTLSGVILTIFRVCGNGDYGVCYVSQHEEISTRAPRFCVANQAPHAVAGDRTHAVAAEAPHAVARDRTHSVAAEASHAVAIDGTHASLELDHMRSPQTGARARAARLPPIELDTKGQALHRATPSTNGSARSARRR